ncbi:hypothetical protein [Pseudoalteromonas rubra]|nr:hypothetical protein [Pseudoalteromonas rubra]
MRKATPSTAKATFIIVSIKNNVLLVFLVGMGRLWMFDYCANQKAHAFLMNSVGKFLTNQLTVPDKGYRK